MGPSCKRIGGILAWVTLVACAGCEEPRKLSLTDTEGRTYSATCKEGGCDLASTATANPSAPKPDDAQAKFVLHAASRLFAVCEVWTQGASHAVHPADCRALVCKSDGDCPPAQNMSHGTCTNGLCIEPSAEITNEDAVLLCLAGTGFPAGTPRQVQRHALGNACPTPCSVPAVCRQP